MRRMVRIVVTVGAMLAFGTGHATEKLMDVPAAYVIAANRHGVPPEVLYAVASAESVVSLKVGRRPWPWTLNVAGRSLRFITRNSACQALTEALKHTRVVDVGIAQLNVRWHPQLFGEGRRFATPCEGLDPDANLDEAAALIRQHYEEAGDWLVAAGRYHHPSGGQHAQRYRAVVSREMAHIGTSQPMLAVAPTPFISTPLHKSSRAFRAKTSDGLVWITPTSQSDVTDSSMTWISPSRLRGPDVATR